MDLETRINTEIKKAMLSRDTTRLESLRAVKAALLLAKTDKSFKEIGESEELAILQRLIKQRKESARIYTEQNRLELAKLELSQALVIQEFLPVMMNEEEVRQVIIEIIKETGSTDIKELGKIMGIASKKLAGKAENRLIAQLVRDQLQ